MVDNAIKHHDRKDGRMTLTAQDGRDALMINVADDSIAVCRVRQSLLVAESHKEVARTVMQGAFSEYTAGFDARISE